jgi:hypothetical protein
MGHNALTYVDEKQYVMDGPCIVEPKILAQQLCVFLAKKLYRKKKKHAEDCTLNCLRNVINVNFQMK